MTIRKIGRITSREEIEHKNLDKEGASIVWYGGFYAGLIFIVAGLMEILSNLKLITLSWGLILAVAIFMVGIGIVTITLWLKKVILQAI